MDVKNTLLNRKMIVNLEIMVLLFGPLSTIPIATLANATEISFIGTVYAPSLIPVQGAEVTAIGPNGFGSAFTDALGQYHITQGLYTGDYMVAASAAGYVDAEIEDVHVTSGQETANVNFLLDASGGISGTVTDAVSDLPLEYVTVEAINAIGGIGGGSTQTDANGDYRIITNLPTGLYNVTAQYTLGHIPKTVGQVSVVAGIETLGVDLALDKSATITGTLRNSKSGVPLPDIVVFAVSAGGVFGGYALTNSTGQYSIISNIGTDIYNVSAPYPTGYVPHTAVPVSVVAGYGVIVDLALDPSGIISGQVTVMGTDQPVADAMVIASLGFTFVSSAQTNATGFYAVTNWLGTGSYTVIASAAIGVGAYPNPVDVIAGQETPNIDIQIMVIPPTPSGIITGTVTNTTGSPIQYATVTAQSLTGFGSASTDVNGFYNISSGLDSGTYIVNASAPPRYSMQSIIDVDVTVGSTTSDVNFQLSPVPPGTISGTVESNQTIIPEFPSHTLLLIAIASTSIAVVITKLYTTRVRRKES